MHESNLLCYYGKALFCGDYMNTDLESFRQNISSLFAASTGVDVESANKILFEGQSFDFFDEMLAQGSLELVRTQLQFFETSIAAGMNDGETMELLSSIAEETKQKMYDFAVNCLTQKKISEDTFVLRTKKFVDNLSNQNFRDKVWKKAQNLLGTEIYV